jgi:hypothetical protein
MIKTRGILGMTQNAGEVIVEEGAPLGYSALGILPHIIKKPSGLTQVTMGSRQHPSLIWGKSHSAEGLVASMVATVASTSSYASAVVVIMTNVFAIRCYT